MTKKSGLASLLVGLAVVSAVAGDAVAVDMGSESYKTAVIAPGHPREIVFNENSQRKTYSAVAIHEGLRKTSMDALHAGNTVPEHTFVFTKGAIGLPEGSPALDKFREGAEVYQVVQGEDGRAAFQATHPGETGSLHTYTGTEVTSIMLEHASGITQTMLNGRKVRDLAVTVPAHTTAPQREVMSQAAELAGFRPLVLVDELAAAAVEYALLEKVEFSVEKTAYVVIADVGAASTRFALVGLRELPLSKKAQKSRYGSPGSPLLIDMVHQSGVTALGGKDFDAVVYKMLVDRFMAAFPSAIHPDNHPKTGGRLRKQAKKTKEVLSANQASPVIVESLQGELDLVTTILREEFEEAAAPLFNRLTSATTEFIEVAAVAKINTTQENDFRGAKRHYEIAVEAAKKKAVEAASKAAKEAFEAAKEAGELEEGTEEPSLPKTFADLELTVEDLVSSPGFDIPEEPHVPTELEVGDIDSQDFLESLAAVEIIGGAGRMQKAAEILQSAFGRESLDRRLNSDEAAVMGATYVVAGQTSGVRVRDVRILGRLPAGIDIAYGESREVPEVVEVEEVPEVEADADADEAEVEGEEDLQAEEEGDKFPELVPFIIPTEEPVSLLKRGQRFPVTKKVSVEREGDFSLALSYSGSVCDEPESSEIADRLAAPCESSESRFLSHWEVTGVPEALEQADPDTPHKISLAVRVGPDGRPHISVAEAVILRTMNVTQTIPITPEELAEVEALEAAEQEEIDAEAAAAKVIEEEEEAAAAKEAEEAAAKEAEEGTVDSEDDSDEGEKPKKKKKKPSKKKSKKKKARKVKVRPRTKQVEVEAQKTIRVAVKASPLEVAGRMQGDSLAAAKARLEGLAAAEQAQRDHEEAFNDLETMMYHGQELMYEEEFVDFTSEEERETFNAALVELEEWIEVDGHEATTEELQSRFKALKKVERSAETRRSEAEKRPEVISQLRKSVEDARAAIVELIEEEYLRADEEELDALTKRCDEIETWVSEKTSSQSELKAWDDAAFMVYDVEWRSDSLDRRVKSLTRRKKKKKSKKEEETISPEDQAEEESLEGEEEPSEEEEL